MRNDFKYYQQLFIDMAKHPGVATVSDLRDVSSASVEEQGKLAIFVLKELDDYWEAINTMRADKITEESHELLLLLLDGLKKSTGFSYEDFAYVADEGSLSPLIYMLSNESCPVEFFVDYSYSRIEGRYSNYLRSLGVASFTETLNELRWDRVSDVAEFLRKREPELETLSDEMVLIVSGISFSRY